MLNVCVESAGWVDKCPCVVVESAGTNKSSEVPTPVRLSEQLELGDLWEALSECLLSLAKMPDSHAVLVLQPAVEAFFLVHAG